MTSKHRKVILYGRTLITDEILKIKLGETFEVNLNNGISSIWQGLDKKDRCVMLLEITEGGDELDQLRYVKCVSPSISIIVLGEDMPKEKVVEAFSLGACDYFKIPYNRELLVERIIAVSRKNGC